MSITTPRGFVANGVSCGIKPPGALDLALVASDDEVAVPAAGVFTSNLAPAAPVQVSRAHLTATGGRAVAVVVNSGNANAATGRHGRLDAERTCALAAAELGCRPEEVLVCSTGLIGIPLPMSAIEAGVSPLVGGRAGHAEAAARAAQAILTTDTVRKEVVVDGDGFSVGGIAKGAAMLAPDMATMLAVLTTDAGTDAQRLGTVLREAVDDSFNALSVDGCQSTNDTVVLLASGRAGPVGESALRRAIGEACRSLARQMASDAEGATKVVSVQVTGAASAEEARRAARKVADSQLVKCSLYGADPYWGRIVSELGSAGVAFDLDRVRVAYGGVAVCAGGVAAAHDAEAVRHHVSGREVVVAADLGLGEGAAEVLTTDLTPGYIEENRRTS